jgi:predicted amidohydrolase
MARIVRGALFQATWPGSKEKMIEKHVRAAEEAAQHGARIMCWQEVLRRISPAGCEALFLDGTIPDGRR